jgi:hypothetical protein
MHHSLLSEETMLHFNEQSGACPLRALAQNRTGKGQQTLSVLSVEARLVLHSVVSSVSFFTAIFLPLLNEKRLLLKLANRKKSIDDLCSSFCNLLPRTAKRIINWKRLGNRMPSIRFCSLLFVAYQKQYHHTK